MLTINWIADHSSSQNFRQLRSFEVMLMSRKTNASSRRIFLSQSVKSLRSTFVICYVNVCCCCCCCCGPNVIVWSVGMTGSSQDCMGQVTFFTKIRRGRSLAEHTRFPDPFIRPAEYSWMQMLGSGAEHIDGKCESGSRNESSGKVLMAMPSIPTECSTFVLFVALATAPNKAINVTRSRLTGFRS